MTEQSDQRLLLAFQRGDADAFGALVDRYQTVLLRYARFLPCGKEAAEDVVQEAFLRLVKHPPELPGASRGPLLSWLYRVTRNLAMERYRSEARRRVREQHAARVEATDGNQAVVEQRDTRRAVEDGLMRLNGDQREVLVLRLLGERSYREIAEITGRRPGTVAWQVSEGLKNLGRMLAPVLEPARSATPASPAEPRPSALKRAQGGTS